MDWSGHLGHGWEIHKIMLQIGYKQRQRDHILFSKHNMGGNMTILLVYIDNIIVTGNDEIKKRV